MTETAAPVVILSSGHSVTIEQVMLFPSAEIAGLIALRSEAARLLGGTSSGIGFIGSPTWAIGGALALGFIEGLANRSMKDQAMALLDKASAKHAHLIESGRFFQFDEVAGMHLPFPQGWSARVTESVTVKIPGREVKAGLFARIAVPGDERIEQRVTDFCHFEQDFIQIKTTSGPMHLKWSDVSAYRAPPPPPRAETSTEFMTNAELAALKRKPFTDPSFKAIG